jgi:hypothetical protein
MKIMLERRQRARARALARSLRRYKLERSHMRYGRKKQQREQFFLKATDQDRPKTIWPMVTMPLQTVTLLPVLRPRRRGGIVTTGGKDTTPQEQATRHDAFNRNNDVIAA